MQAVKDNNVMYSISNAVLKNGIPYIGSSAGSNIAGISIGNTNDMPAAESYGRKALGLVPFNINPHYIDPLTLTDEQRAAVLAIAPQLAQVINHKGETRDTRIKEYHALNNLETVVALREGAMLRINDDSIVLKGTTGAKVFKPKEDPIEFKEGDSLDFLLR